MRALIISIKFVKDKLNGVCSITLYTYNPNIENKRVRRIVLRIYKDRRESKKKKKERKRKLVIEGLNLIVDEGSVIIWVCT